MLNDTKYCNFIISSTINDMSRYPGEFCSVRLSGICNTGIAPDFRGS